MNLFTRRQNISSTNPGPDQAGGSTGTDSPVSPAWLWILWFSLAVAFAFIAAASFAPDKRLWGVNHLAFYSDRARIVSLAVAAVFFIPPISAVIWKLFNRFFDRFSRGLNDGVHTIALTGVVSFITFAALRSSTLLLGDGYYIANNFREAAKNGIGLVKYFGLITVDHRIYPATDFLNYSASTAAAKIGAVSSVSGVWMLNCLIGAIFVIGLLIVVKRSSMPAAFKITAALLVVMTGAVELFFGYVENYTPVIVLGAAFVITAYRALSAGGSIWTPGIILAVAVTFHVQALLLAPAYVFLVLVRAVAKNNPGRIPVAGVLVATLTVIVAVAVGRTETFGRFFLSPVGTGGEYGVFSPAHLLDAVNIATLLCPAWLLFALFAVKGAISRRDDPGHQTEMTFGCCLFLPALLFLLLFNPELGMARDWDLYCFTVVGMLAPGLLVLKHLWPRLDAGKGTRILLPPALAVSALIAVAWIGINANPSKSVMRYQSILEYDLTNPGYAYESLSRHFEDNFDLSGQIESLEKAYATSRNPRYLVKLGKIHETHNDLPKAAHYLRAAVEAKPDFDDARRLFIAVLRKQRSFGELIPVCQEGIQHSPKIVLYHFALGEAYFKEGMIEEGLKAFDACSKLNPSSKVLQDMSRITDAALNAQREDVRR